MVGKRFFIRTSKFWLRLGCSCFFVIFRLNVLKVYKWLKRGREDKLKSMAKERLNLWRSKFPGKWRVPLSSEFWPSNYWMCSHNCVWSSYWLNCQRKCHLLDSIIYPTKNYQIRKLGKRNWKLGKLEQVYWKGLRIYISLYVQLNSSQGVKNFLRIRERFE